METLVLIPTKPNIEKPIYERSEGLIATELNGFKVVRDFSGKGDRGIQQTVREKALRIAQVRQKMIDENLRDEDYVLWIDCDIIDYTRGTIEELIRVSHELDAITAPLILIEDSMQFWDIAGFIYKGNYISRKPPFFNTEDEYIEMDSVGCFYVVPSSIYKTRKYIPVIAPFNTEHYNICKDNRTICCQRLSVTHVNFSKKYNR